MEKRNHDLRIPLTQEERICFDKLYNEIAKTEFKKTGFWRAIFFMGYQTILLQLSKKSPEEIKVLLLNNLKK
jgi:hypothetical protein